MFLRVSICLVALSALACRHASAATTPLPNEDPFYTPPAGFESAALGTVFKNRTIPSPASGVSGVQFLYRTTGAVATEATVSAATVLFMGNYNRSQLVAFSFPEDADWNGCSPSYAFYSGNSDAGLITSTIQAGLNKGWPVVVPDYEGLNSTLAAGLLGGRQVLDSLRAALNFKPLGISPTATLGGHGYSSGAISSAWGAQLQKSYAPELNIVGWAFGGTPPNLTSALLNVANTSFAGIGFAGLFGLLNAYPETQGLYAHYATAAGKAALETFTHQCLAKNALTDNNKDVVSYEFCTIGPSFLYLPQVAAVLKENTMGLDPNNLPTSPVYMYHSKTDEAAPYSDAVNIYKTWCTLGAPSTTNIQFVTVYGGTGHTGLGIGYEAPPVAWLNDRLRGTPLPKKGCFQTSGFLIGIPLAQGSQESGV